MAASIGGEPRVVASRGGEPGPAFSNRTRRRGISWRLVAAAAPRHGQKPREEEKEEEKKSAGGFAGHGPAGYNIPVVVSTTVALYVPAV